MNISKEQYEVECLRLLAMDKSKWPFEARVAYQLGLQEGKKEVFEKMNPKFEVLRTKASEHELELDLHRQTVGEQEAIERGRLGIYG